jgi:hypothetical protein
MIVKSLDEKGMEADMNHPHQQCGTRLLGQKAACKSSGSQQHLRQVVELGACQQHLQLSCACQLCWLQGNPKGLVPVNSQRKHANAWHP